MVVRKDFKKVLCTKGRRGGMGKALGKGKGHKRERQRMTRGEGNEWSLPSKETMNGRSRRGDKHFIGNLNVMIRFLRSSVGRKWDDVYSEFRKVCSPDSVACKYVLPSIWHFVERNVQFIDGKVYNSPEWSSRRYGPTLLTDYGRDTTFYIDQEGSLRRAPRRERVREKKPKNKNKFERDGVTYARKDRIWYKTALLPLPKPRIQNEMVDGYGGIRYQRTKWVYPTFRDVYLAVSNRNDGYGGYHRTGAEHCIAFYGKKVYCWQLRQLNSRELKKLGLKNMCSNR